MSKMPKPRENEITFLEAVRQIIEGSPRRWRFERIGGGPLQLLKYDYATPTCFTVVEIVDIPPPFMDVLSVYYSDSIERHNRGIRRRIGI